MTTVAGRPAPAASSRSHVPAWLTLAAGALFVLTPPLVQLVSSDAFALMGLAGLLLLTTLNVAVAVFWSSAHA